MNYYFINYMYHLIDIYGACHAKSTRLKPLLFYVPEFLNVRVNENNLKNLLFLKDFSQAVKN